MGDLAGAPTSSLVAAIMSSTAAPPTLQQHVQQQQQQQHSRLAESTSVYVSGLPRDFDEKDLGSPLSPVPVPIPTPHPIISPLPPSSPEALFSPQGTVKKIKVYKGPDGQKKGDALVTYHRADAAATACIQVFCCFCPPALAASARFLNPSSLCAASPTTGFPWYPPLLAA